MGKIKKAIKVILIILMVICGIWFISLSGEDKNNIYTALIDVVWRLQGKRKYIYEISIKTKDSITFNNGITEKELHSMQDDYYRAFSNYIYMYEYDCFVKMYEGNYININSDNNFDIRINVPDSAGYMPFDDMSLYFFDMKSIEMKVDKDKIICKSEEDMGKKSYWLFNHKTDNIFISFQNADFEVYSVEIRLSEDGKPAIYLDIDGDGIYEHDGSVYTYAYWAPRDLLEDYNKWVHINYAPITRVFYPDYPVIMRGEREIAKWIEYEKPFYSMENYRKYVEGFATKEYAQKLIDEGYVFEYNGELYREVVYDKHVYYADYSTRFSEVKGDTWMEVSFLTKDKYNEEGYTDEIWRVRYEDIDKGRDMRISNVWVIDRQQEQKK